LSIRLRSIPARQSGWQECFRKVGTRAAQAISKVAMATAAVSAGGIVILSLVLSLPGVQAAASQSGVGEPEG